MSSRFVDFVVRISQLPNVIINDFIARLPVTTDITTKPLRKLKGYDSRELTQARKKEILDKYDYTCVYCFNDAEQVDHIIPWSYAHDDREENLVACCWICNLIAYNKIFDTFRLKSEHIQAVRYRWIKRHPITLWLRKDVDELGWTMTDVVEKSCVVLDTQEELERVRDKLVKEDFIVRY